MREVEIMRVGAMVVGILFSIWTFLEGMLISGLAGAAEDEDLSGVAGVGVFASLFVGVAAVIVLAVPQVSMVLFGLGGIISYLAAANGYGNHWVYGTIFFGLAVMAFFGWRGKLRDRKEAAAEKERQRLRDEQLETLLRQRT